MSKTLDRIAALLALGENTDSPAEREAAMTKAQALATQCQIDLEVARQHQADKTKREAPEVRSIKFYEATRAVTRTRQKMVIGDDGRYLRTEDGYGYVYDGTEEYESYEDVPKPRHLPMMVDLFGRIASANSVKNNIYHDSSGVIAFGLPSDIDVVETLHGSLAVQMVAAADKAIKDGEHRLVGDWNTRTGYTDARVYRSSFYEGFINTVGMRLREARREAIACAKDSFVGTHADGDGDLPVEDGQPSGAELVLRNKEVEVADFYKEKSTARGSYRGYRSSNRSAAGSSSGAAAGRRANLGTNKSIANRRSVSV